MSLFASSFESGVTAGPSSAILPPGGGNKSNKRKRPSLYASEGNKEEQLRATQKNLERLMSRVEKGDVKPKEKKTHQTMNFPKLTDKQLKKALSANRPQAPPPAQTKKQKQVAQVKPHPAVEKEKEKKAKQHKATPAKVELDPEEVEGLTDLQKGMKSKLEGARFRWINEQLYSTPSTEAVAMMKKDPKIFADYHMTHRDLTSAWPSPPLPYIVDLISPLPAGTIVVDLGCGDAGLAKALTPEGKIVLSYDLVGDSGVTGSEDSAKKSEGWVVEADFLEKVPLPGRPGGNGQSADHAAEPSKKKSKKGKEKAKGSEVVDVVVCCLSLMGVNWVGGIYEACRVLKAGGTLHVAEVTSRFISTEKFTEKVESFGFKLENEESPSTHFTLFRFTKTADVPIGPVRGQSGWNERVQEGEEILRGCVYKKR